MSLAVLEDVNAKFDVNMKAMHSISRERLFLCYSTHFYDI